ncbi:MAG: hypothetical protein COS14_10175 [Bacteroidetes bacterium CG02_land_8_20_14_3_00_31_25]|nr:hypothetical protein [Bacteroidota bacterium]PIV58328.1 MAG: hypothetical protein COS14_10175 [Bacteroidetes bacterium CG02_land_8_20_14_3_00_31_25]PIX35508.1 MAG: hypothetical protein COZ59_06035 [Bacteroidetes bacterium CG_4_8_14_3_um_filter_31_14]PIY04603.1 MAG: hypothetical protein COZ21_06210 [Bacteroidetes bacterium CG_4_10_14_3_um_filter_31_20]
MRNKILIIILFAIPFTVVSQNCVEFLSVQRTGIKYPWKYDAQSKAGFFVAGKSSQLNIVCNEGKDYKISFLASSAILKFISISVTDESGKEFYTLGVSESKKKDLESKKQFMLSLQNQKVNIKTGKKRIELDADINKLTLEINKYQQEVDNAEYSPKTFFEFTPAETVNLIINISVNEASTGKGCIGALISNKKAEKSGF